MPYWKVHSFTTKVFIFVRKERPESKQTEYSMIIVFQRSDQIFTLGHSYSIQTIVTYKKQCHFKCLRNNLKKSENKSKYQLWRNWENRYIKNCLRNCTELKNAYQILCTWLYLKIKREQKKRDEKCDCVRKCVYTEELWRRRFLSAAK